VIRRNRASSRSCSIGRCCVYDTGRKSVDHKIRRIDFETWRAKFFFCHLYSFIFSHDDWLTLPMLPLLSSGILFWAVWIVRVRATCVTNIYANQKTDDATALTYGQKCNFNFAIGWRSSVRFSGFGRYTVPRYRRDGGGSEETQQHNIILSRRVIKTPKIKSKARIRACGPALLLILNLNPGTTAVIATCTGRDREIKTDGQREKDGRRSGDDLLRY